MPGWLARLLDHLRGRGALALLAALVALSVRLATPAPPARTVDAIARMLGDAAGGTVGHEDFVWEERGGFLRDALEGRRVLFLARPAAEGQASAELSNASDLSNVYRARVRLTRTGRPISLEAVHDLTDTALGDERSLVARGRRVAFITAAPGGGVQGITLLDLGGDAADREARTRGERILADAESWLETGSPRGVARVEITFRTSPSEAQIDLTDDLLLMALGPERIPAALDLRTGELNTGGKEAFGVEAQRIPRPARSFAEVATLAATRLLGPGAARTVDRTALAAERLLRRPPPEPPPEPPASAASAASAPADLWPPPPIAPVVDPPLPGEGRWAAANGPFLEPAASLEEAHFLRTFLRPDPARPESRVHLLAIDSRRIELRLQAGYAAPRPATGLRGTGRIPKALRRAPGIETRPAAATAPAGAEPQDAPGATEDAGDDAAPDPAPALERAPERVLGAIALDVGPDGGMVVDGRVLTPPRPGAPTLAVDRFGRALFGPWRPWPSGDAPQPAMPFLVQGTAAFARDAARPAPAWDDDLVTERAALCVTPIGLLIHAWARAIDAPGLDRALALAGCRAGMGIGRRPAPLGFVYLDGRDDGGWRAERLSPLMSVAPERLAVASPGPFAYLVQRDPAPAARLRRGAWTADTGTQPRPSWMPGIYSAEVVNLGARVRLTAFSPDRFELRLRAGLREISPRGAPELPEALAPEEAARALAAVGLGNARRRGARGLAIGGAVGLRFRSDGGIFMIHEGRAAILPVGVAPPAGADAAELPLTADEGKLRPEARDIGAMRRRAAACVLDDGTLVVATTSFDSDEATTEALLDLGCTRVAALDRGAHRPAFLYRAGAPAAPAPAPEPEPEKDEDEKNDGEKKESDDEEEKDAEPAPPPPPASPTSLQASYDETTLFVLETPMRGRAGQLRGGEGEAAPAAE